MPTTEQWKAMLSSEPGFQESRTLQQSASNAADHFGNVYGVKLFTEWSSRNACMKAKVHRASTAGIVPGRLGAYSVVLSGTSYADKDTGDTIRYTGTGGTDDPRNGGEQIKDQTFVHSHNDALRKNVTSGHPVRVIRGSQLNTPWSPSPGINRQARYDGLYTVKEAKMVRGKDGYKLCQYILVRVPGQDPIPKRPYASHPEASK